MSDSGDRDGYQITTSIAEMMLREIAATPDFMEQGACADPALEDYFPINLAHQTDEEYREVAAVCESCPVLKECDAYFTKLNEESREIKLGYFGGRDYTDWGD